MNSTKKGAHVVVFGVLPRMKTYQRVSEMYPLVASSCGIETAIGRQLLCE